MEPFDVVGLFLPALEKIGSQIIGFDDKIRRRYNNALEKALKPNDEFYIRNAKIHITELVGLIVLVMDEPSSINTITIPNYISRDEFRRFYDQVKRDEKLWGELQKERDYYKAKDTNSIVKAMFKLLVRQTGSVEEFKRVGEKIVESIEKLIESVGETKNNKACKVELTKTDTINDLYKYLHDKLENKRKSHPSFRLMDIDEDLFPDGMITFDTEARDSNNELKTVSKIVSESWERGETNHLMIEGEGGIGKTVTLLSLPDNFAPHPVPAIYIPLHELKGENNTIEKYIKGQILDSKEQYDLLQNVIKRPWAEGPNLLLLLDGFNEIPVDMREAISEDIEQWSEKPGLQIITSSRFDIHQYVALRSSFSKIELQPLSEETVSEYLVNNKIGVPDNPAVIKLITTPLLLTLYIKAEAIRNDRPSPFAKFKETKNAGLLIWNYLQCELWPYRNKKAESKASVLALEFIAPYIAWTMQQHTEFVLDESSFYDRIDEAYLLLKNHVDAHGQLPDHIKTTLRQSPGLPNIEHVGDLLKEHLCLFINNEGEYRLMHQQFRDALAALHLINMSYLSGDSLPQEWNTPIDHYVMQFVVDLMSEDEAMRLWEQNRKTTPMVENATRNQLRLQGLLHNNSFIHLNFSNLDLSSISLYPYRITNATIKLPRQSEKMANTKLSDKTFSPEGHVGTVYFVTVTPDGKRIVSGSGDSTIRVWDLETGDPIGKPIKRQEYSVNAITVTPDGKRIVDVSGDSIIRVWDLETGNPIEKPIRKQECSVNAVAMTPDGKCIVSGSGDIIRVWDLETGKPVGKSFVGHKHSVIAVAVTPDGKRLVSGSRDNTIRVWDLETGKLIGEPLKGHENWVNTVAVTSDCKRVVSGSGDNTIRVWDLQTGEQIGKAFEGHEDWVYAVAVTPDGKRIVSGSGDSTIRVWDLETGDLIGKPIKGHVDRVNSVAVTPDGKRIVSGARDNTIRIWDLETGNPIGRPIEGHKGWVNDIVITPNRKHIISGSDDNVIRVWDFETRILTSLMEGHTDSVNSVAVTPDGKCIVSGSKDRTIRIWDFEAGELIKTLKGHEDWVNAVAVMSNGKYVVSGSWDSTIRIWDMGTGKPIRLLKMHDDLVNAIAITPNGKYVVSGTSNNIIRIWDLETGNITKTLCGHGGRVHSIAVTPNGKFVVSGSKDRTIRIWDLETGDTRTLEGHMGWVTAVAVTHNGKYVVSGSDDGTIRIWNTESVSLTRLIEGNVNGVEAVALTENGKPSIISAGYDTIYINDVETYEDKTIHVLPLSVVGYDFSRADISDPELKETLRQNGAKV